MNATLEPADVMTHNRMSGYFANETVEQTKSVEVRHAECVLAAVVALTKLLTHDDPAIVMKVAGEILSLEKTRLRHGTKEAARAGGVSPTSVAKPRSPAVEIAPPSASDLEMLNELEKMLGMASDEEEEDEEPEPEPTEAEALAYHAVELRSGMSRAAKMDASVREVSEEESVAIVQMHLKMWNVAATAIPRGGFWREVATRTKK